MTNVIDLKTYRKIRLRAVPEGGRFTMNGIEFIKLEKHIGLTDFPSFVCRHANGINTSDVLISENAEVWYYD